MWSPGPPRPRALPRAVLRATSRAAGLQAGLWAGRSGGRARVPPCRGRTGPRSDQDTFPLTHKCFVATRRADDEGSQGAAQPKPITALAGRGGWRRPEAPAGGSPAAGSGAAEQQTTHSACQADGGPGPGALPSRVVEKSGQRATAARSRSMEKSPLSESRQQLEIEIYCDSNRENISTMTALAFGVLSWFFCFWRIRWYSLR